MLKFSASRVLLFIEAKCNFLSEVAGKFVYSAKFFNQKFYTNYLSFSVSILLTHVTRFSPKDNKCLDGLYKILMSLHSVCFS